MATTTSSSRGTTEMEMLQNVFPSVPATALQRVLEICDYSVEAASEWLLENDWNDLFDDTAEAQNGGDDVGDGGDNEQRDGDDDEDTVDDEEERHDQRPSAAPTGASRATQEQRNNVAALAAQLLSSRPPPQTGGHTPTTMVVSTENNLSRNGGHESNGVHRHHRGHHNLLGQDDGEYDSGGDQEVESEEGEEEDEEEDEEDDDDDDDEDDDGDAHSYYDSSDESYLGNAIPPLTKRVKVTSSVDATDLTKNEFFWAAFDDQVVPKTLIELLNTTLTKLAHSRILLLNKSSKRITESEARDRIKSILTIADELSATQESTDHPTSTHVASGNSLSRILNGSPPSSPSVSPTPIDSVVGQKRKRTEETTAMSTMGFFAHFFTIGELDMVWRSIMHAHLFNGRFGELIEFHTAATGSFSRRDFDELQHIHTTATSTSSRAASMGVSPLSSLKCCLLLPCEATEDEIFRVGKHVHTLLKLPGSLYYRTLTVDSSVSSGAMEDLLNEDGKLTEESFRRFARYRIKKEETDTTGDGKTERDMSSGADHFLAYQQQRKVTYCLQALNNEGWGRRVSG